MKYIIYINKIELLHLCPSTPLPQLKAENSELF